MKTNNLKYVELVTNSIQTLAIDKDYACWLIQKSPKSDPPEIRMGSPLSHYCELGFDTFTGKEISDLIPEAIAELNGLPTKGMLLNHLHALTSRLSRIETDLDNVADTIGARATFLRNKRDDATLMKKDIERLTNQLCGVHTTDISEL